ncbi:hypothetical protein XENOCAPTIV_026519 [Xenoophorus captivus]|uniref:Uncharacterized protein n=1 Tax=Xenoophorus captivus TaxID=1517983 RepID=A0ABV0QWQ3_9TELE
MTGPGQGIPYVLMGQLSSFSLPEQSGTSSFSVRTAFKDRFQPVQEQVFCGSHDKVLTNKTPKLDRSDGVKEMKEKAPKRKLPFTAGANGDQKDSDSGRRKL